MASDNARNQGNVTKERLAGTPFENATEMNAARQEILEDTWRELERARAKRELLAKPDYQFFLEPFRKGMLTRYGEKNGNLVRVSLGNDGIQIDINEEMKSSENSEALLEALIRSMSDSFMSNYLKSLNRIAATQK
jgi:hypothetical protein